MGPALARRTAPGVRRQPAHRWTVAILGIASGVLAAACGGGGARDAGSAEEAELPNGDTVTWIESAPRTDGGSEPGAPVLLLHGAAYRAQTWEDLGVLDSLAQGGHRAIAVDLPGRGGSTGRGDREWLLSVMDELDLERVVLVAPSASGPSALDLLGENPERLSGFVPVAPVGGADFLWPGGAAPPTVVVLGEDDSSFASGTRALAEEIPGAELAVIDGAGHAAYEDRTDSFLAAIRPAL